MYNKESYDALRRKYGAEGLPNMFEKLHADMGKQMQQQQQREEQQKKKQQNNGHSKGNGDKRSNGTSKGLDDDDVVLKGRRRKAIKGVVETVVDKAAGRIGNAKRSPLLSKA